LQPAANEYAAEQIMGNGEEVHKILSGLARGHESTVLYASWGLVKNRIRWDVTRPGPALFVLPGASTRAHRSFKPAAQPPWLSIFSLRLCSMG
jgi:hypothetical protein